MIPGINVTLDFRDDASGKDPDTHSRELRRHHRLLWSKPLPSGESFLLEEKGRYLRYRRHPSGGADLVLSSDSVIPTFGWSRRIRTLISQGELDAFNAETYTIGGMMIFPAEQVGRKRTINQERGCAKEIRDRFDLTLECIRRHYEGCSSPLTDVLARYADFFAPFESFQGYVEFFLLQDLVRSDYSAVKISLPFDDFSRSPIPETVEEYREYRDAALSFVRARNERIRRFAESPSR